MGTTIYIHGRPQGQDIWNQSSDVSDNYYLESFLGSKLGGDVNAAMITDIRLNNSYYTYIHCKNVYEKSRDRGPCSYFAITVRIEGKRCVNVSKLYNLLEQVYNLKCKGTLIDGNGNVEYYLIDRFVEKANELNNITSIIEQNIERIPLELINTSADTFNTTPCIYSLDDIDSPVFFSDMLKNKLIISPFYSSKTEKMNMLKEQIQPLEKQCHTLADELNSCKQINVNHEHLIKNLQKDNIALNEQKESLTLQLKNESEKVGLVYKKALKEKTDELDKANKRIQQLSLLLKANEKKSGFVDDDNELLLEFKKIKEPLIRFSQIVSNSYSNIKTDKTQCLFWKKNVLSVINLALVSVILIISSLNSCNRNISNDDSKLVNELNSKIKLLERDNEELKADIKKYSNKDKFRIDINGYKGTGPLKNNKKYQLSLPDYKGNVEWSVVNGTLKENVFTVNEGAEYVEIKAEIKHGLVEARKIDIE